MARGYYRTGAAAKILGISPYHLRRLCETGLVDAQLMPSGHWRIPVSEIERLRKYGVPAVPQGTWEDEEDLETDPEWLDEPEDAEPLEQRSAPSRAVVESADQVKIAKYRLERRKIERDAEEVEDWFRDRAQEEAARQAARAEAEQQRRDDERAILDREEWENDWHSYAVRCLPFGVSPEVKMQLPKLVNEALRATDPSRPDHVTRSVVDAAVEKVSRGWRRQQEIDRAIQAAVDELPWAAKDVWAMTEWQTGATASAREAVNKLVETASAEEIKAVARQAVACITRAFEQFQACQKLISSVAVAGATYDEQKEAKEIATQALAALHLGASQRRLQSVVDEALAPFHERVAQRKDQALRLAVLRGTSFPWGFPEAEEEEALTAVGRAIDQIPRGAPRPKLEAARERAVQPFLDAHVQREKKHRLVERGLGEIFGFLLELERNHDLPKGPWTLKDELKDGIQKHLEEHLTGEESDEDAIARVRKLVRQSVKLQPKRG